jgi:hypothetical protein
MATDAKAELARMRRSLREWLRYRDMNTAAGLTAQEASERVALEAGLAAKMRALLLEVYGQDAALPGDATSLARMIIVGQAPATNAPQAQGFIPLLILAGAVVLLLMHAISTYADYAKERERYECIEKYGAWKCDTQGQLVKWGIVAGVAWLAWTKFGLGTTVKRLTGGGRRR